MRFYKKYFFCELSFSSVDHHILHNLLTWSVTAFLAHATSDVMTTYKIYKISANSSGRYLYKYLLRRWTFLWNDGFVLGLVTSLCWHVLCRTLSDHWQRAMNDLEVKTPARRMQGMEKESNDSDKQTSFAAALGFVCLSCDNNWYRSVIEYFFKTLHSMNGLVFVFGRAEVTVHAGGIVCRRDR